MDKTYREAINDHVLQEIKIRLERSQYVEPGHSDIKVMFEIVSDLKKLIGIQDEIIEALKAEYQLDQARLDYIREQLEQPN